MSVDVVHVRTTDAEVGQSVITDLYASDRPIRFASAPGPFVCDLRFTTAGDLVADRVLCSAGAQSCVVEPMDYLMVVSPVHGQQVFRAGRDEVIVLPGDAARYPTDTAAVVDWEHFDVATIRLPLHHLHRVGDEHGLATDGPLRFTGFRPVDEPRRQQWLQTMRFVHDQLGDTDGLASRPLVQAHLAELVAATALSTFPNSTMDHPQQPGPGWTAPVVVRRALAHIDEHAGSPLTVTDVAHAVGLSARALRAAFVRHVGTTPGRYLRQVQRSHAAPGAAPGTTT